MANKAQKTEHNGAKHGSGAYRGRKADAKGESDTRRREADRAEVAQVVSLYYLELLIEQYDGEDPPEGDELAWALGMTEGGCACDEELDAAEDSTMGLACVEPATWCFRCLAVAALDEAAGWDPGVTVLQERARGEHGEDSVRVAVLAREWLAALSLRVEEP